MPGQTQILPESAHDDLAGHAGEWIVIVFDNDVNTFEQVIDILQKATACSLEEAQMETWEIHHLGRSIVHHGPRAECHRAAAVIGTIGIRVAIEQL